MSKEATVQSGLTLRILNSTGSIIQDESTRPSSFTADVSQAGGPTPGAFLASTSGTQVVLTALTQPGLCVIQNLGVDTNGDSLFGTVNDQHNWTNYVELGIYVTAVDDFFPLCELLPGESYVLRLSRFIGSSFGGTDAGTSADTTGNQLRIKAIGTACKVVVRCHER